MPSPIYTSISLFTGAGGLDLGLHQAGFTSRVAIESDQEAINTLLINRERWKNCTIIERKIESVSSIEILEAGKISSSEVTLLVGGPPCQPFSKSGYWHSGDAKRLSDPRAQTLKQYFRVMEDLLPEVFLIENVPGLAFSSKDEGLTFLKDSIHLINRLKGTNYSFHAAKLNAVEYGIPQTRERVFVVGHRDGKKFSFPASTHTKPASRKQRCNNQEAQSVLVNNLLPYSTAWDALAEIESSDDVNLLPKGKWADLLPSIPEGHNYLHHTNRGEGLPLFGWRRRYWSMLLKLAKNRPAWTITAQPGPSTGPFHWLNRRLSQQELAALQTFPKGYLISGSILSSHKQLGNAVPSALAEIMGLEIRRQLLGESELKISSTLIPAKREDLPAPEKPRRVPKKYQSLLGDHDPHPGPGLGPGALQ